MTDARKLDSQDLEHLRLAGEWKLLRDLRGRKVCLTGKMSMERSQLAALVEAADGQFTNAITSTTSLLVVSEADRFSSKTEKAAQMGVPIMTEQEFAAELLPTPEELLAGRRAAFGDPR